ncbi:unnamed protein product [Ilex paraguariensis]|uniref:WRKY domain-containing protein n=1 Tax=Ilex paraguariensis TaxID=185542 RepID=A0ABC8T7C0_9AQUA
MGLTEGAPEVAAPARPITITLPPRSSFEGVFSGGAGPGFSPGPMTLVTNFFSDHYPDSDCHSFSQLLAGAMASPVAAFAGSESSFLAHNSTDSSLKEANSEDRSENKVGFKQNRPMSLVVAPSPMFLIPPGLTPSGLLNSPGFFSPLQSPFGMSHQQALAHVTAQAALSQSYTPTQAEYQPSSVAPSLSLAQDPIETTQQETHPIVSGSESSKMETLEVSQSDRKLVPAPLDKPANDGYNWRKYGQKQVKTSEYHRSYYKCTYLTCPVKKKVERATDGQITGIVYKGEHNHELPRSNKRVKVGDVEGTTNSQMESELGSQVQTEKSKSKEALPSQSVPRKNQVSTQSTSEQLPGLSDREEMDDAEMIINDGGDEPNSKRRNTQMGASDLALSHKMVTEPRIIVQTRSEVDLLDDGFKWRKYGQKVVKGNPHPRSYYRCTFVGCNVRKHVERASTDPKSVITTYEGKHSHDIPAARNRIHSTASGDGLQSKPKKVVHGEPALHVELDFGSKDQRQVLLQLKEEQIAA